MHSLRELEQGSHNHRKAQHFLPSRSLFLASRACSSPRAAACSFGHLQLFAVVGDGLLQQRMTGSKQYLARYSPGMQFPTRHKPPSWLQLSGPCVCPVERSRKVVGKCLSWQGGKIKVGGASQGTVCLAKPMLGVCRAGHARLQQAFPGSPSQHQLQPEEGKKHSPGASKN